MTTWGIATRTYTERQSRIWAPETAKLNRITLSQAVEMIGENKKISSTTRNDLEDLLWGQSNSFLARGLAVSTINASKDRVCAFVRWCLTQPELKLREDITHGIKKLPTKQKPRLQMEADLLLDALDAAPNERDRMLIAVGTFTGLRISDVKLLMLRWINLEQRTIQGVCKKTGKVFDMKFCPELAMEMESYLSYYANQKGYISPEAMVRDMKRKNLDWYLVPRMTRPVYAGYAKVDTSQRTLVPEEAIENIYHMLGRVMKKIGITASGDKGFHTLRRSAARHMYERACEQVGSKDRAMRMVQIYLGHSTMAVTERYVGITVETAALHEFLANTPLLGDAYENRYSDGREQDNVLRFRKKGA